MKKLLLILLTLSVFITFDSPAQSVSSTVENQMDSIKYLGQTEQYCLLVCTQKMFSTKVTVTVDFGQTVSFWTAAKQMQIKNESGELKKFESVIDALHYLNSKGWFFATAYPMSSGQGVCYHYLMKRTILKNDLEAVK